MTESATKSTARSTTPSATRALILTNPGDFHTFAVAEALERKGCPVVLWHGTDLPSCQRASVSVGADGTRLEVSGTELALEGGAFDVVWNRRPSDPVMPPHLHPADLDLAERDCRHFVWSLWRMVAPEAFWVNPLPVLHSSLLKPRQLHLARQAGLEVPETLCSNDPRRIEAFLRAHPGETVYKSFHSGSWKTPEGVKVLYTTPVTEADLPDDDLLQAAPGIYQVRVPKSHELRVTFFGDEPVTARLLAQQSERGRRDWRSASSSLGVEPDELPAEITAACRRLMRELGIVFGCFDFIVTPEGRHVFLEINPMGQFLFLERRCPELELLDRFCELLIQATPRFVWPRPGGGSRVRLADVWEAAQQRFLAAPEIHVPRRSKLVDEARVGMDPAEASLLGVVGSVE